MSIVSLQDIRDEGVTVDMASDSKVLTYISIWEAAIEAATNQWFDSREMVVTFDGDGTSLKLFQVPIIEVDSLEDLGSGASNDLVSPSDYRVYNSRNPISCDDRRNPKIVMPRRFSLGRQRWRVSGTFGFLEPDGSAPADMKYAMLKLIIEKLLTPLVNSMEAIINEQLLPDVHAKVLTEEITDDHKRKWSYYGAKVKPNINGWLTQDQFILGVIDKYRAPMNVQTQTNWTPLEGYPTSSQIFFGVYGSAGVYS